MTATKTGQRSRSGCNNCRRARIKCDETKPECHNCSRRKKGKCDYSLQLVWGGQSSRGAKKVMKDLPNASFHSGVLVMQREKGKKRGTQRAVSSSELECKSGSTLLQSREAPELNSQPFDLTAFFSPGENIVEGDYSSNVSVHTFLEDDLHLNTAPQLLWGEEPFSNNTPSTLEGCGLSLRSLAHPAPDFLFDSSHHAELFSFYLSETSHLLVPTPYHAYRSNPFNTILPQLAMESPTLLKLLLAFAANHRKEISNYHQKTRALQIPDVATSRKDEELAGNLLTETFGQLLSQFTDKRQRHSSSTLATILMLAGFDIFFGGRRNKWRAHVNGARGLLLDRLSAGGKKAMRIVSKTRVLDADTFLIHWFSYLNIIGSLSSVKSIAKADNHGALDYDFDYDNDTTVVSLLRAQLKDIDYFTGLETKILSLLAQVAKLINQKEACDNEHGLYLLLTEAIDLAQSIESYLNASEDERDRIYHELHLKGLTAFNTANYKTYKTLRATNAIFALTGVLQINRRILNVPRDTPVNRGLLVRITRLIREEIPLDSSAESCIIVCLFCCGCELIGRDLDLHRDVYMCHIETLLRNGMTSAHQAKVVMEHCWKDEKSWWEVLEERNLDLSFAI
ncbi:LAFA_0F12508g1_1 [Lachancea sp. 'fantastica']|nr:LAFA_0F12508g1_1 [Lachancea sp. 'fantastica']